MAGEKDKKPDKAEESITPRRDGEYIKEYEKRDRKSDIRDTFDPPPRPDKKKEND